MELEFLVQVAGGISTEPEVRWWYVCTGEEVERKGSTTVRYLMQWRLSRPYTLECTQQALVSGTCAPVLIIPNGTKIFVKIISACKHALTTNTIIAKNVSFECFRSVETLVLINQWATANYLATHKCHRFLISLFYFDNYFFIHSHPIKHITFRHCIYTKKVAVWQMESHGQTLCMVKW